jgi:hypothetical protein
MDVKHESTCGSIAWSRAQSGRCSPGAGVRVPASGDALFSAPQLASKQPAAYAAREAKAGNVRVQASERVGGKREIGVQVSKKSLPISLKAHLPQHLEQYDCSACMLADKHYGTKRR